MGTRPWHQISIVLGLCALLLMIRFSSAATQTETLVTVVGTAECLDCAQKSIKNEHAVKGLHVAINCKMSNEKYETKVTGELDSKGNFNVNLPSELLQDDGQLKHECFAQLHSTSNAPCPDKNGLNPSKLVLKSKEKGQHTFVAAAGKLSFSSASCVSATFWPPYNDPWHKTFPKYPLPPFTFPPKPYYHPHPHPFYKPPVPTYKPPSPGRSYYNPPAPVYKPPAPEYKPPSGGYYKPPAPEYKPPSGGYYKPPAPVYKPPTPEYKPPSGGYYHPPAPVYKPTPTPVYKPPSGGYYNPPAPVYKPTPVPYYKHPYHPIYKKPLPPMPQLPPFYHPHPKLYFPPIYRKPLPSWPPYSHWHKKFYKPGHPSFPPAKVHRKP